jgi:hypothetical protein
MVGAELALMTSTIERVIVATPPRNGTVAATEMFRTVVAVSVTNWSTSWIRALEGMMAKMTMGTMHECFIYDLDPKMPLEEHHFQQLGSRDGANMGNPVQDAGEITVAMDDRVNITTTGSNIRTVALLI